MFPLSRRLASSNSFSAAGMVTMSGIFLCVVGELGGQIGELLLAVGYGVQDVAKLAKQHFVAALQLVGEDVDRGVGFQHFGGLFNVRRLRLCIRYV